MALRWPVIPTIVFLLGSGSVESCNAQSVRSGSALDRYEKKIAAARAEMLVDPQAAQSDAAHAERTAAAIVDPTKRGISTATAQWLQGEALLRTGNTERAGVLIAQALVMITSLAPRSKLYADILLSRGGAEGSQGRVGAALIDYQSAFSRYRILGDHRGQAMALLFIAWLYTEAMDQETALKYYDQAIDTYGTDPSLSVSIFNNRATAFSELKRYKEAMAQFKAALVLANQLNSRPLKAQIYANIALLQLADGNLAGAEQAMKSCARFTSARETSGLKAGMTAVSAQLALRRGQVAHAVRLITKALAELGPAGTSNSLKDIHQTAYDVFQAAGDSKSALVHLQALKRLDDDATKLATSTKTALMAARFDFANQELKISQLKADELRRGIAFERARAQTQRYVFFGVAAAVAAVIALLAFGLITLRRSRDQVRAANDDLAITNGALGKALMAKTEFLATTSHEIRTPLNGILGMTQVMLADPQLTPAVLDRLGIVHGAGLTMRALVDDILDVAKMETGNLTIESAPFDLCATVTEATRMWADQAHTKGLSFEVDLGGCPAMIHGDAARVRQIVFNLLSNAIKFTKSGRVALTVDADEDGQMRVAVSDSGIGIPADKLDEIFESFRQAEAGTTRQFGGTGLGLSICRNLARAMGGDVSVASVEGEGATFTLVLPLTRADATVADVPQAESAAATLIVDRNPIMRSMFGTLLAPHGGPVFFAVSVDEAVAHLASGNVVRVLIDDATVTAGGEAYAGLTRIAVAAEASGAETTLLWPLTAMQYYDDLIAAGVTRIIAKPVGGAALIRAMFGDPKSGKLVYPRLVSDAA
jgi:signal transduction histidine kinase